MPGLQSPSAMDAIVHPLVYFQKPAIGSSTEENIPPVQTIFPNGGFAIGTPMKDPNSVTAANQGDHIGLGILASAPMNTEVDLAQKRDLATAFLIVAFVNFIVTILMYSFSDEVDLSKVEMRHGPIASVFEQVSPNRRSIENINFGFTVCLIILGSLTVVTQNSLGISAYALGVTLNFFLATYSLPYFLYSFRYMLDLCMLYLVLVFRSRLVYTFLPIHLHRQ